MAKILKKSDTKLTIGTKVYALFKDYVNENRNNVKIRVCKVKTFQNKLGTIIPILTEIGKPSEEIDSQLYYLHTDVNKALKLLGSIKPIR